ncbi:hypothetical protein TREES_T100003133 [Tupaia chinensis]|uniref:Uncharacterized protein n=1 Tax=Tupaia chinensis TaxID=246437 RepID=L9KI64_TUPCH|nr:hypothetical protein TREES_T100003133 [Tupaia chinensis]
MPACLHIPITHRNPINPKRMDRALTPARWNVEITLTPIPTEHHVLHNTVGPVHQEDCSEEQVNEHDGSTANLGSCHCSSTESHPFCESYSGSLGCTQASSGSSASLRVPVNFRRLLIAVTWP